MDYQKEKRIIIFFFIVLWCFLFYFAYKRYENIHATASIEDFTPAHLTFVNESDESSVQVIKSSEAQNSEPEIFDEQKDIFHPELEVDFSKEETFKNTMLLEEIQNQYYKKNFFDEEREVFCGSFPCYTNEEFVELFDIFETKKGNIQDTPPIYNSEVDTYLRGIATKRGYKKHFFAKEKDLVTLHTYQTQKEIKEAYEAMSKEMKQEGISLHFVSGYRSFDHQKKIFKTKMGEIDLTKIPQGVYDEKIMKALNLSALPGYSKHHTGYAVDFGCGDNYLVYQFANTACYKWMSKNNFENAKRFGFIPSYPNGLVDQGPNPEPWEYVWVGADRILKKSLGVDSE